MSVRRFELHNFGKNSHKYWELHQSSGCWHPEYGRIAGFGRSGGRSRGNKKCDGTWRKTLAGKLKKGYAEITGSQPMMAKSGSTRIPAPTPTTTVTSSPKSVIAAGVGLFNWNEL